MRKLFVGLIVIVLFLGVDVLIARALKPHAPSTKEAVRQVGVDIIARSLAEGMKIKLHLPQRVDDITTLEDVTSQGDRVVYTLTFNADAAQFNQIAADIAGNVRANGCDRPDYRKLFDFGLTVVLDLRGPNDLRAPVVITPKDCGL